jgi:hypothetical protein
VCGGWPHLAGTTVHFDLYLCVVPMMPKNSSVLPHSAVFTVWARSFSSSNQYGPMMPCFEMATHAVHFVECTSARHPPVELYPNKHYSCCLHILTAENVLRLRTRHDPKSSECLPSCHKNIDTWLLVFPCPPV